MLALLKKRDCYEYEIAELLDVCCGTGDICRMLGSQFIMPLLGGGGKHHEEYMWLYESTKVL